jgi:mono/diheme cytochrome c family protein
MVFRAGWFIAVAFIAVCVGVTLLAAPTAEQRKEIEAINGLMTKAAGLFTEKNYRDAGAVVKEVQTRLVKAAEGADPATLSELGAIHKRLEVAHSKLKSEGIALPNLGPLAATKTAAKTAVKPAAKPTMEKPGAEKTVAKTAPAKAAPKAATTKSGGNVSFVSDVAPILNNRCGGCHVRKASGAFQMNTFDLLMKGSQKGGKVIFPGDVKSSILIDKVADKEMPPNGTGIPDAELATLKKWVQDGAKFDGKDTGAQITTFVAASTGTTQTPVASVQMATGKETVSFGREIAPIIAKNCLNCHGRDMPRNNLEMTSIRTMFRGGDRGEPVLPGKPADSLLLKKIKGTADGARMPLRAPALPTADIEKIEKWIAEGAKFDGSDQGMPLPQVAAIAKALSQTHEQLTKDRMQLAQENWHLGMPNTTPSKFESTNFFVIGNVGETILSDIAKKAEALSPKVAEIFKAPKDQPLVKGRMALFVFGERYDYGEFGKMVEKRDLSPASRGHYRFTIVDAYGAVLTPKTNEYDLDTLIAQQLGAVYVAALGKNVPHWFAEGCGRVVASRMAPTNDRRVAQWDQELSGIVGSLAKPDDFIDGKMPPENADICSASFCKVLMGDRRFVNLMESLRKGAEFDSAFSSAMGGKPGQMAVAWARNPPTLGRGGGRAKK